MLHVTTQDESRSYNIYYFHLEWDKKQNIYYMMGLARYDLQETELVVLGAYSTYQQAIQVFAEMTYRDNDIIYYQNKPRYYFMPANLEGPIEIVIPDEDILVYIGDGRYKLVLAKENFIEGSCLHIRNNSTIEGNTLKI